MNLKEEKEKMERLKSQIQIELSTMQIRLSFENNNEELKFLCKEKEKSLEYIQQRYEALLKKEVELSEQKTRIKEKKYEKGMRLGL